MSPSSICTSGAGGEDLNQKLRRVLPKRPLDMCSRPDIEIKADDELRREEEALTVVDSVHTLISSLET